MEPAFAMSAVGQGALSYPIRNEKTATEPSFMDTSWFNAPPVGQAQKHNEKQEQPKADGIRLAFTKKCIFTGPSHRRCLPRLPATIRCLVARLRLCAVAAH